MNKLTVICGFVILGLALANYPGYELYNAAKNGDTDFVKQAITEGTDVNSKNPRSGSTALMVASHRNQVEVVKLLIDTGVKVDEVDIAGHTALYFAASTGSTEVVPLLISSGADVNVKTVSGTSAVTAATKGSNLRILKMLINAGADVNIAQNDGWTPLHFAAQDNKLDIARELLQAGANAHAIVTEDYDEYDGEDTDPNESTPITIALENGHIQLANFIEGFPQDGYLALLMKKGSRALKLTYAIVKFVGCIFSS